MIEALSNYVKDVANLLSKNSIISARLEKDVRDLIDFETALAEVILQILLETVTFLLPFKLNLNLRCLFKRIGS